MLTPATHMYMYEIKDGMKLYWLFPLLKKEVRIIIIFFLIVENKYYECFNNKIIFLLYFFPGSKLIAFIFFLLPIWSGNFRIKIRCDAMKTVLTPGGL